MAIARPFAVACAIGACLFQRAIAAPSPSLIDQFKAGCSSELYAANPGLATFENIGSADGLRFEKLMDETRASFVNLQRSMDELNVQPGEIVEIRVESASAANLNEVEANFAATPELAGLPFSYRVVDHLPVSSARIGFYAVADTAHGRIQASSACTR